MNTSDNLPVVANGDQTPGEGQEARLDGSPVTSLVTVTKREIQPVGLVHLSRLNSVPFCRSKHGISTTIEGIVNCADCLKMVKLLRALASKTENVLDVFYRIRDRVSAYSGSFHRVNKEKRDDWPTVQAVARSMSLPIFVITNMCDHDPIRLSYHDEPKGCPQPALPNLFVEILERPKP